MKFRQVFIGCYFSFMAVAFAQGSVAMEQVTPGRSEGSSVLLNSAQDPNFPLCDDAVLKLKIKNVIAMYEKLHPQKSPIDRRQRALAAKKDMDFSKIDLTDFKPSDNREVATQMIMHKLGDGLSDEDLRLCASFNPIINKTVYLLMIKKKPQIIYEIINYIPTSEKENILTFTD